MIFLSKRATFENQPMTDKAANIYPLQSVNYFYEGMKDADFVYSIFWADTLTGAHVIKRCD